MAIGSSANLGRDWPSEGGGGYTGDVRQNKCILLGLTAAWAAALLSLVMPSHVRADAQTAMACGDFAGAVVVLREQAAAGRDSGDAAAMAKLQLTLASAYQSQGQLDLAIGTLNEAVASGLRAGDDALVTQAYVGLTQALTWTREFTLAEVSLGEARRYAAKTDDPALAASLDMASGLLLASRGEFDVAQSAFERAAAAEGTSPAFGAAATINASRAAAGVGEHDAARRWADEARSRCDAIEDSHDKAAMLTAIGSLQHGVSPAQRHAALTAAVAVAERIGDQAVLAAALTELALLYEQQGRTDEAMRLSRRAVFVGQQTGLPDLIYRSQWQMGRLFSAQGKLDQAIAACSRALDTVQSIRPDLSIRYSPVATWPKTAAEPAPTFRRVIGPLYFELADLYFKRADQRTGDAAREDLLAARDTIEKFRSAEIQDYFQERCVEVVAEGLKDIAGVGQGTAVVYFVPLRDRLEVLVTRDGQLQRFTSPIAAAELDVLAEQFRRLVETRGSYRFMPVARQMYAALIEPIKSALGDDVHTLVFIPDGSLRTVPMAALHDGERFLIERYAVAVSPGLQLMAPSPIKRQNVKILLSGVSEAREISDGERMQKFSSLPYVPGELERIGAVFGGQPLLDADFQIDRVQDAVAQSPYNIVHIATHGEFGSQAADSFLLAYDRKMTLDKLEEIIRPAQFRGEPVELLTLSACRTAAGDDRAALGLAGVAIKAGARSALATLWYVNDEASSMVVARFYELIHKDPMLSKARALQQAQSELIRFRDEDGNEHMRHPSLWSPYIIIGNWL
jgi:CHAT domain-containing protein